MVDRSRFPWVTLVNGAASCSRCGRTAPARTPNAEHEWYLRHFRCPPVPLPPLNPPKAHPPNREPLEAAVVRRDDDELAPHTAVERLSQFERDILLEAIDEGARLADNPDLPGDAHRMVKLEKWLDSRLPGWLSYEAAEESGARLLRVMPLVDELRKLTEFDTIRLSPLTIDWFTGLVTSKSRLVLGRAGATSPKARATWRGQGPAPWFRVELSLLYWLVTTPTERERLVHHELCHCDVEVTPKGPKPVSRAHDVEEHLATALRYGPDEAQALLIDGALRHQDAAGLLERLHLGRWQLDEERRAPKVEVPEHRPLFGYTPDAF